VKSNLVSPSWFNLFIPISIAAHFIFPIEMFFHSSLRYSGIVLILVGMVLNLVASSKLRISQTPVEFNQIPAQLVITGPYRYSRNPIYLGGLIILLGVAFLLGSLVSFFFPVILFLLLQFLYIPFEEREMERIFGLQYIDYKRKVRRWV
jgi:protein-S-isoprenylcysteine O-methyltransferase Ste14